MHTARSPGGQSPRAGFSPSAGEVALAPPPRTWLGDLGEASAPPACAPLTILQWNVLMDLPLQEFQYLSAEHGTWAHRGPMILAELFAHAFDVAGLQEVSRLETLATEFSGSHYIFFAPKLSSASTPMDGCALLLSRARFEVLDVEVKYYAAAAQAGGSGGGAGALSNQNAIIVTARDVLAQRAVVLAVTHLKASQTERAQTERLAQVEQLGAAVRCARVRAEEHSGGLPVPCIVLGDFNSYPGSKPYHAHLTLMPDMASAYNPLARSGSDSAAYAQGEPAFTTYKYRGGVEKRETEDYIWYSEGRGLQRCGLLRLPGVRELGEGRGLPSRVYPSDHLLLGARFAWLEGQEKA
jgi:mRNA deadenylase 3'-5' endonuclease subunit Ccr4